MKKFTTVLASLALLFMASSVFAFGAAESNIDLKAGIAYPASGDNSPGKVGFDSALSLNIGLDKYFALGVESGFGWLSWKNSVGTDPFSTVTLSQVTTTNAYTVPALLNARVRFDQRDMYGIMPYIAVGAGYSWTFFSRDSGTRTFHGFTWQAMAGCAFRIGEDSNMEILAEAGYRGAAVTDSGSYELDMSGLIAHVGVRFPLGGGDSSDDF
ncbi:MAG: porin family protein [bacterium]|nr:porin family protein [bacterium]